LLCEETETIRSIKEKLVAASNQHHHHPSTDNNGNPVVDGISAYDIRLIKPGCGASLTDDDDPFRGGQVVMKDEETIHDLELPKDKAILYMIHRISDDDTWESVDVVSTAFDAT
jgi:hypothetical protein